MMMGVNRRWHNAKHCPSCGRIRSNHYGRYCCRPGCQLERKRRQGLIMRTWEELKREGKV